MRDVAGGIVCCVLLCRLGSLGSAFCVRSVGVVVLCLEGLSLWWFLG